jgi:hypothetical protein
MHRKQSLKVLELQKLLSSNFEYTFSSLIILHHQLTNLTLDADS